MAADTPAERIRTAAWVEAYRARHPGADRWAAGYGTIDHDVETQARIFDLAESLSLRDVAGDEPDIFEVLHAADRVASATMWLVVHLTYADQVHLDGRDLAADEFTADPQGHTGGSLNMAPAYVGYLAANAISGLTRSWIMGQGHTVAAIDSANVLVGNTTPAHAERYPVSDEGLSRLVTDFYSYRIGDDGRPDAPVGSHVNAHTAGSLAEGGYLGFTELQYVHMPLPGERLVVFLSDGAFEEQRGSDWAPRWWRAEDSGLVAPFMIANGRRIDQRTTMKQQGGIGWFLEHLRLNHFDPFVLDGTDPAAFAWATLEMETRLQAAGDAIAAGEAGYPVRLPYGVAVAPKGAGFYGEGTVPAHNLPLPGNPRRDTESRRLFNEHARRLWVPEERLRGATAVLSRHGTSDRPRERDHVLVHRDPTLEVVPDLDPREVAGTESALDDAPRSSPMRALDDAFLATVEANPHLRPRIGNPDEMRSNRMMATLEALRFRVTDPEPDLPESLDGAVVTALNEEAVASAALANKGGINLVVTYEAFGTKMHGEVRQEITWASQCAEAGRPQRWLSIPLVMTSHTWENAKNEYSHQDPSMCEAMLGERSDVSRVVFPPDANTTVTSLLGCYRTRGQYWTMVVPKHEVADLFDAEGAARLLDQGALHLDGAGHRPDEARLVITAVGAYQLEQTLRASRRLAEVDWPHRIVYLLEPGRFRRPRTEGEERHAAPEGLVSELWPAHAPVRLFVTHTRPETLLGVLQPLNTGAARTAGLGFRTHGGTLTTEGLQFVNGCTWAHVVAEAARLTDNDPDEALSGEERRALAGRRSPHGLVV